MKKVNKLLLLIALVFVLVAVVACNTDDSEVSDDNGSDTPAETETNGDEPEPEPEPEPDPVHIVWAYQGTEEQYQEDVGRFIEDKFPHVTVEPHDAGTDHPETLEDLIAQGNPPDIVTMGAITHTSHLRRFELDYDMSELIEQESFDLDRYEPSFIEFARKQDPDQEGRLVVLPMTRPTYSLHYNKDIFDTFGVDYPEDGITWEELIVLAEDLTREHNGIQYRGLDLDTPYDAYTQFSQNSIDPDTDEVLIAESEAYRRYVGMIGEVTSIPGNYPEENPGDMLHNWGTYFGEGNVAMTPIGTNWGWLIEHEHIDIATYPVWEGYEGIGPQPRGRGHAIARSSENKEVALQLIDHLLSEEVQMIKSREGIASPLDNPEVHAVFNADIPELQGKNLDSLFIHSYATGPEKRARYGDGTIDQAGIRFANTTQDLNEFLRILQEEAEENVRAQMERD